MDLLRAALTYPDPGLSMSGGGGGGGGGGICAWSEVFYHDSIRW